MENEESGEFMSYHLALMKKWHPVAVWWEAENALEAIIGEYERVNHLISFVQDERARIRGLEKAGPQSGVGLELGSGPGNFTEKLRNYVDGSLICLDFSDKMLRVAKKRNEREDTVFLRAVFEALPFRGGTLSFVSAAYALRDTPDKLKALLEIRDALSDQGLLLIIDIGKPNNTIVRGFFSLYMRHIVPLLAGLVTRYGYRNPWSILYKTYEALPVNIELGHLMEKVLGPADVEELAFGGLVVATSRRA